MVTKSRKKSHDYALRSSISKLIVVILVCLAIRSVSAAIPSTTASILNNSEFLSFLARSELGSFSSANLSAVNILSAELPTVLSSDVENENSELEISQLTKIFNLPESTESESPSDSVTIEPEVIESPLSLSSDGITIKNSTGYDIDVDSLLNAEIPLLSSGDAQVLILHTHACEAYTPDGDDIYEASDPYRTLDENYSVIRVGLELANALENRGITVIHDTTLYDYPNYNYAYASAWEGINSHLTENPNIKVVIDLHRDALEGDNGTVYKTIADIGDSPCAQVMLVVGTDYSGLSHEKWQENLSFALKLQCSMIEKYPSLARPLNISKYRYNQHATTGSLIVEVGCSGNTLQESLTAVTYFADCLADVLDG